MGAPQELAMQCPGCFAVMQEERMPDQDWECDTCGEKFTVIDLRDGPVDALNVDRGSLTFTTQQSKGGEERHG